MFIFQWLTLQLLSVVLELLREICRGKYRPSSDSCTPLPIIRPIHNMKVFSVDFTRFTFLEPFELPTLFISFS